MRTLLFVFLLFITASSFSTENNPPIKFDFQSVNVSQVIQFVYGEALQQPFVIDPLILRDDRMVSFRFDSTVNGDFRQFWLMFIDSLGFVVTPKSGVDFVGIKKPESLIQPSYEIFIYHPHYRSLSYLVDLLSSVFRQGAFSIQRSIKTAPGEVSPSNAPENSAASKIQNDSDVLVFQGTHQEIEQLKSLLSQVDLAVGEVLVSAVVYEVSTGQTDGTAFSLALNLISGKLGASIGGSTSLANMLTFKDSTIDSVFSSLSGDSRFKALSTPRLRVKSGTQARLVVGQDVPTLGAVSYPQAGGVPVQTIEYRSAGVILDLQPIVRESTIDLIIDQQISDFAKTETGVNNSPTLTKRSLSTSVNVSDGELIVLGGLTQDKNSSGKSGLSFLPGFMKTSSESDHKTEILLLLQVKRI